MKFGRVNSLGPKLWEDLVVFGLVNRKRHINNVTCLLALRPNIAGPLDRNSHHRTSHHLLMKGPIGRNSAGSSEGSLSKSFAQSFLFICERMNPKSQSTIYHE